jgi:hypothetical protein
MHSLVRFGLAAAVVACLVSAAVGQAPTQKEQPKMDVPQLTISNDVLKLTLYLPDAEKGYYRGTRFDWSGMIARAELGGRTVFGPFRAKFDPTLHDHVVGPAEEFDIDGPAGYAEAKVGEPFMKIGVGLIEKVREDKYGFWNRYKLAKPGPWKVASGKDWVRFEQELALGGYGYVYTKRITLKGPSFTLAHTLRNTGTKAIDTVTYCHNFTIIDDEPVGPSYRVVLPFKAGLGPNSKPAEAEVKDGAIAFKGVVKGSVMLFLDGLAGGAADNAATIENTRTGTALKLKGDRPLVKYNFYAEKTAACPEPFVRLRVEPGKQEEWATEYTIMAGPKSAQ